MRGNCQQQHSRSLLDFLLLDQQWPLCQGWRSRTWEPNARESKGVSVWRSLNPIGFYTNANTQILGGLSFNLPHLWQLERLLHTFFNDSESISELTFTNMCQLMHTDALEWRSHCSFPQVLKEVIIKKSAESNYPSGFDCWEVFLEIGIFCYSEVIKDQKKESNSVFKILKIQKKLHTKCSANPFYQLKHKMGYHTQSSVDHSTNSYKKADRSLGIL